MAPVLILLLQASALPLTARAAWLPNGVPVSSAVHDQTSPVTVPDGAGGAIIAWVDNRSGTNYDIYAQRIDGTGAPLWTLDGVALCTDDSLQAQPTIVSDGAGGAIVAWTDYRNGATADLYAQHVNASGSVQWTANGVAICTAAADQVGTPITTDGAGGAIITWHDYRSASGYTDIYAQRIDASGTPQWSTDGVAVCTATNHQTLPMIDTDGAGGAIIVWQDSRNPTYDVYAQRVNASGTPQWTTDGVVVSAGASGQISPVTVSDGAGGAIVTWLDGRNGPGPDVYAQRISPLGSPLWTVDGVPVCVAASFQTGPTMVSDGANGAIITWYDIRSGTSYDIYAQHMSSLGAPQWTANGVAVCTAADNQYFPQIVTDGAGGAIIYWGDARSGFGFDAYLQRVDAAGVPQWTADGISPASGSNEGLAAIASDGAGGVIVAWEDFRNGDSDIYALRLDPSGSIATGVSSPTRGPSLIVTGIYPNPFSGTASLDIELTAPAAVQMDVFDVAGRRVRTMLLSGAASQRIEFDGRDDANRLLPSGVYFYRITAAGETVTNKMVIAR